jgi:hypothetical protein
MVLDASADTFSSRPVSFIGLGEFLRRCRELTLNLQIGPYDALDDRTPLLGHVLGRHDHAELGADRLGLPVFEVLREEAVALHDRDRFERLPAHDGIDLTFLERLVEVGAATLDVDGLEAVVGNALLDQRRSILEPDRGAGSDRNLLAFNVVPAVELHAGTPDDVFWRGSYAHQPDDVGRALRQSDGEIRGSNRRNIE